MKTENTLENRLRFIGLYYGQKVLYVGGQGLVKIGEGGWNLKHPEFFLKLIPIESMSDIDGFNLGVLHSWTNPEQFKYFWLRTGASPKGNLQVDFLRSKGYAIPWMDLSVQDLINYGWIKLVES